MRTSTVGDFNVDRHTRRNTVGQTAPFRRSGIDDALARKVSSLDTSREIAHSVDIRRDLRTAIDLDPELSSDIFLPGSGVIAHPVATQAIDRSLQIVQEQIVHFGT